MGASVATPEAPVAREWLRARSSAPIPPPLAPSGRILDDRVLRASDADSTSIRGQTGPNCHWVSAGWVASKQEGVGPALVNVPRTILPRPSRPPKGRSEAASPSGGHQPTMSTDD